MKAASSASSASSATALGPFNLSLASPTATRTLAPPSARAKAPSSPTRRPPPARATAATALPAADVGVRGRRTGLMAKGNVAKDADQLDNIEDFFASPTKTPAPPPPVQQQPARSGRKSVGKAPVASAKKRTPAWARRKQRSATDDDEDDKQEAEAEAVEPAPKPTGRKSISKPAVPPPMPVSAPTPMIVRTTPTHDEHVYDDDDDGVHAGDISTVAQRLAFDDDDAASTKPKPKAKPKAAKPKAAKPAPAKPKPKPTPAPAPAPAKRKSPAEQDDDDEPDLANDGAMRKSKRHRVAPVAFWKNEKIVYKEERVENEFDDQAFVPTLAAVIRSKSPDAPQKRVRKTKSQPAREAASEPDFSSKGYAKIVGEAMVPVRDAATSTRVELDLVRTADAITYGNVSFGRLAKIFDTPGFISGVFTMSKGGVKQATSSANHYILFTIHQGTVGITIDKSKLALSADDTCYVPPHNKYMLEALGSGEVRVHYVFVKLP